MSATPRRRLFPNRVLIWRRALYGKRAAPAGNDRTASIRQSRPLFEDSRRKRAALLYLMSRRAAAVRDEVDSITPIAIPMVSGQRIWSVPDMMRSPRPFFKISRNQSSIASLSVPPAARYPSMTVGFGQTCSARLRVLETSSAGAAWQITLRCVRPSPSSRIGDGTGWPRWVATTS
jgi:hypothetical protein